MSRALPYPAVIRAARNTAGDTALKRRKTEKDKEVELFRYTTTVPYCCQWGNRTYPSIWSYCVHTYKYTECSKKDLYGFCAQISCRIANVCLLNILANNQVSFLGPLKHLTLLFTKVWVSEIFFLDYIGGATSQKYILFHNWLAQKIK